MIPVSGVPFNPNHGDKAQYEPFKQGTFKVIKTREKGTLMIVRDIDTTDRTLLFAGIGMGFRGGCSIAYCSGTILQIIHASSACDRHLSVAAILAPGEVIDLKSWGRYGTTYKRYNHDGVLVSYTKQEYEALSELNASTEDGEQL